MRPANWNTRQGDSLQSTAVRQLAGTHNAVLGSMVNEARRLLEHRGESGYTNAAEGAELSRPA